MKKLLKVMLTIGEITFRLLWIVWFIVCMCIGTIAYVVTLPIVLLTHDDELAAQVVYIAMKAALIPDKLIKGAFTSSVENERSSITGMTIKEMLEEMKKRSNL